MTTSIKSSSDGSYGALQVGGVDSITFDADGILSGYKDNSIPPAKLTQKLTQVAAVTAAGTAVDFTGIPSWAKRITVSLNGVSTNGTSSPLLKLGSSAVEDTGYLSVSNGVVNAAATTGTTSTAGFICNSGNASNSLTGVFTLFLVAPLTYVCVLNAGSSASGTIISITGSGSKTLAGALTSVRLTTVNGTDTFDAGTISLLYEG